MGCGAVLEFLELAAELRAELDVFGEVLKLLGDVLPEVGRGEQA